MQQINPILHLLLEERRIIIGKQVTEQQLIKRCQQGDRLAQQDLYEQFASKMLGVCRRYVGSSEEAEDLLHDGFITLFRKIGDFRSEGSFEGWMRRIFVTTALGYLRKHNVLNNSVQVDQTVIQFAGDSVTPLERMSAHELLHAIDTLPLGYRTVLNLFAVEGYSHQEIAEMLGINEGTSRSQYARAKQSLQKILTKQEMQT